MTGDGIGCLFLSGEGGPVRAGDAGEGSGGELLDGRGQGDVAQGRGIGLAVAGEPADKGGDGRCVSLGDLPEEDVGEDRAGQFQRGPAAVRTL